MNKIAFICGETLVYWSSIVMMLAVLTGLVFFWAASAQKRDHITGAVIASPVVIVLSLLLARLIHWYFRADSYDSLLAAMTDFSGTGYALAGAFAGCLLTALILWKFNIVKNLPGTLDCMSLGGCAAIAIGRLGSFFTSEDYGQILPDVTSLPLAYPVINTTSGVTEYRFATFLFQSIIAGSVCIVLFILFQTNLKQKKYRDGDITLLFLLCYCASQIVLDSIRYDSLRLRSNGFISIVQILCALALVAVIGILSVRLKKKTGKNTGVIAAWLVLILSLAGVGFMEYYVQRHGDKALFAYLIMGICLSVIVVLGIFLWRSTTVMQENENQDLESPTVKKQTSRSTVLISLVLTAVLVMGIALYGGAPRKKASSNSSLEVVERFFMDTTNAISDATDSIMNIEKKYWISAEAVAAPKPDKTCYGKAENPADLSEVIRKAEKLLDGQSLYFSADIALWDDTPVRYYLDDTILVITWKQAIDNTVYTFSEVKIADPSQFRRYLSGGEYSSGKLAVPTEMANTVNSVVASSGDYYQFRNAGVIVYEGIVHRVGTGAATCYIDENGDLLFTGASEQFTLQSARKFVDEHNIRFSLAFGPILVEDGQKHHFGSYGLGEVTDDFARAALCQMGQLHYLLVNANAEGSQRGYPTMYEFAERIYETGCSMAYALDGGQTAAIVMDGELINQVTYGYQRKISDIIYFGTALPNPQG